MDLDDLVKFEITMDAKGKFGCGEDYEPDN
jgi:hypothetical protein